MNSIPSSAFAGTKPHYELLDGLRGVAALLVALYHIFEGLSFAGGGAPVAVINHGYLAVDFFFILSGFVVGYAYDGRIGKTMSIGGFFRRRLARLHPMAAMGAVLGSVSFLLQGTARWDGTRAGAPAAMLALLCALLFIPAAPGARYEVRGNGEMFPLNGPSWSLFFEYIGNLLYAFFIRRLGARGLAALAALSGAGLAWFALSDAAGYGMLGVGWRLDAANFAGGLLRMLFPFTLGVLLSRRFRPAKAGGSFWLCGAALAALFCVPCIEGKAAVSLNGLYEAACIFLAFPLLVWLAASGQAAGPLASRLCRLAGDISYPLYAVHYPVMYLFYAWLVRRGCRTIGEAWPAALAAYAASLLLAWLCLKFYDEPVRRWLGRNFLRRQGDSRE